MKKSTRRITKQSNKGKKFEVNKSYLTIKTYHVMAKNKTESIKKVKQGKGRFIDDEIEDIDYGSYQL